jgi:hypothetical protein
MIAVGVGFGLILNHVTGIDYDKLSGSEMLPSLFVVGLGMMLGWVAGFYATITIGCLILGATRKRPKADKHFPLIVALLARGWTWPSSD